MIAMATLTVSLKNADRLARKMAGSSGLLLDGAEIGLISGAREISSEAAARITRNRTVYTGQLRDSIGPGRTRRSSSAVEVPVVVGAPHGYFIEKGRKKGRVPRGTLKKWVKRRIFGNKSVDERRLNAVTFLVERKIRRRGFEARPFLEPSFRRKKGRVRALVRDAIFSALNRIK